MGSFTKFLRVFVCDELSHRSSTSDPSPPASAFVALSSSCFQPPENRKNTHKRSSQTAFAQAFIQFVSTDVSVPPDAAAMQSDCSTVAMMFQKSGLVGPDMGDVVFFPLFFSSDFVTSGNHNTIQ